ncbi:hypothetical protein D3C81_1817770 [compost metagenome]
MLFNTFTPTKAAPGATPVCIPGSPSPVPAAMLATCVPCPSSSYGEGRPFMTSYHPMTLPPSKSICDASIPVSTTAITTSFFEKVLSFPFKSPVTLKSLLAFLRPNISLAAFIYGVIFPASDNSAI